MVIAEIVLNQKFHNILKDPETYKIILKSKYKFRYFVFEGSSWAKKTKCYRATEIWCFIIYRWLLYRMSDQELNHVLSILKIPTTIQKPSGKPSASKLVLLRNDVKKDK